jgi:soluble lytic murein transglycosylase
MRVEWLKSLGKRAQWSIFGAEYPPPTGEDIELACYGIQFRRARDGDAELAAARSLWFNAQTTPESCEPLFAALIAHGDLTAADRRARFRLATEAGNIRLAQSIAVDLPPEDRISAGEFIQVERDPARALAKGEFAWKHRGGRELALYALERSARTDAAVVRAAWKGSGDGCLTPTGSTGNAHRLPRGAAAQSAGERLVSRCRRRAVVGNAARVAGARRAAWARGLTSSPPSRRCRPRSRRIPRGATGRRALAAIGHARRQRHPRRARRRFPLYGLLSADALGKQIEPNSTPAPPPAPRRSPPRCAARSAPRVRLAALDMRPESQREWLYIVRGQDDEGLLLAADYASAAPGSMTARSTPRSTSSRHDFGLRYMMPFREHFAAAAHEQAVDEALLLSPRGRNRASFPTSCLGGRRRPDAADAADGTLGRETDGPH